MKLKNIFEKVLRAILGGTFVKKVAPEEVKEYIPISKRVCPLCGEIIGFDISFISIGDESYHVACVDRLERLERGEER